MQYLPSLSARSSGGHLFHRSVRSVIAGRRLKHFCLPLDGALGLALSRHDCLLFTVSAGFGILSIRGRRLEPRQIVVCIDGCLLSILLLYACSFPLIRA